MLSTRRINKLLAEAEKLKIQQQTQQPKNNILALLTRLYPGFKKQLFTKNVISADYVFVRDEFETYRPDNTVHILLETAERYIQFSIKNTCKHSEIETKIWITQHKNIDPTTIDFEYAFDDARFIEIYNKKDIKAELGLTIFEKYMIKIIIDGEMEDFDLEPPENSIGPRANLDDLTTCGANDETNCDDNTPPPEPDTLTNIGSLLE